MRLINNTNCISVDSGFAAKSGILTDFDKGELEVVGFDTQRENRKNECTPCVALRFSVEIGPEMVEVAKLYIDGYGELSALRNQIDLVLKLARDDHLV